MGIAVYGSNDYVYRNTLRNIGYCPIYYVWGNNMVIKNNVIDSFCITKQQLMEVEISISLHCQEVCIY